MLSLVIPALNAAGTLGACLEALGEVPELVLVDGGSRDGTREIARVAGARVVEAPRGRGVQLAAGAEAAKGDWLLFLHADTRLSPGWRDAAEEHMRRRDVAGCFRFKLDDPAWQARVIERGVALRVKLLALPYGDQGLLVSRELYDMVGGFRPVPLMEDVGLVRRIGRRRLVTLAADAVTSAERWRRDGWARRSARNLACLALHRMGMSEEKVARLYG
ncbi:MAG TPA: TIGR04283 family arsenosugar biosynthesis glycosyltransferase [Allosphingosinicella sp.]|jgi:rSAM/selenodomain-associated transferase 2